MRIIIWIRPITNKPQKMMYMLFGLIKNLKINVLKYSRGGGYEENELYGFIQCYRR